MQPRYTKRKKPLQSTQNTFVEEIIPFDEFVPRMPVLGANLEYRFGVVSKITPKSGFINRQFVNKAYYPEARMDNSGSVIFYSSQAKTMPSDIQFETFENVYIVRFITNGTVPDTKTGELHPAFSYDYPIEVLRAIPRNKCAQIHIYKDHIVVTSVQKVKSKPSTTSEVSADSLKALEKLLFSEVEKFGFANPAQFPKLASTAGIADYLQYSDSVSAFLQYFLPTFKVETNIEIDGKKYTSLILPKKDDDVKDSKTNSYEHMDLALLDTLYASKRFAEYLASPILENIAPCNLPLEYFEKAINCANRLLFPESNEVICLNDFQKELITGRESGSLIKKWKEGGAFSPEVTQQCANSSLLNDGFLRNPKRIADMLNSIGRSNAKNDNYVGVSQRFASCVNVLVPHLYIIRIFVQKSRAAVERSIDEYCHFIKNISTNTVTNSNNSPAILASLPELLNVVQEYIFRDTVFSRSSVTNIFSTYLDTGNVSALTNILPTLCPNPESVEYKLCELINHGHTWTEDIFVNLIKSSVNLQLLQKSVALLWDKHNSQSLPTGFLRLLAWIIKHNSHTSIDEIVRFDQAGTITKPEKQSALLYSFDRICEEAYRDCDFYSLASYIALVVCPEISSEDLLTIATGVTEKWSVFSEKYFEMTAAPMSSVSEENNDRILALFPVFILDVPRERELQHWYADWFIGNLSLKECADDCIESTFDMLYDHLAYEAYARLFDICVAEDNSFCYSQRRIAEYAESLIALHRYAELVSFLLHNENISKEHRHRLIIKAISENFRKNAMSPSAFSMFSRSFSCEDAIALLWTDIKANHYSSFTALIALYYHIQEYNKAIYLYAVYRSKAEIGYSRLYNVFRERMSGHINSISNKYDAIEFALSTLPVRDIPMFLQWTQTVPIPDIKGQGNTHALQFFYDNLTKNPLQDLAWKDFIVNLSKYIDKNAWHIFVGQCILSEVFSHQPNISDSRKALEIVVDTKAVKTLPCNFLPCTFSYIIKSNDRFAIVLLRELLKKDGFANGMLTNNLWHAKYVDITARFKTFCMSQYSETRDMSFYAMLTDLGLSLDISEMKQISRQDVDKHYLFVQICKNFTDGKDADKMIDLLNNGEWEHLSASDEGVLELLKTLYVDTSVLLSELGDLFPNEESIYRFKQDCAYILSEYPHKTALLRFDEECRNLAHKFRVYAYIFKVLYDEDLYEKYELTYDSITDTETLYALLEFTSTAHLVQLKHNASFDFLYKRFRYLKLYLNLVLRKGVDADDSFIVSAMEKYHHYDDVYQKWYVPMKEDVQEFFGLSCLDLKEKECFLFSLIRGNFAAFLWMYADCLAKLNDDQCNLTRRMIGRLDFRRANHHLIRFYKDNLLKHTYTPILTAAKAFSEFAMETLLELQRAKDPDITSMVLYKKLNPKEPAKALDRIMHESEQSFEENKGILVPWYCASQYAFRILGRWRTDTICNPNRLTDRHRLIAQHLAEHGESEARNVYAYLLALGFCIKKDRTQVASIVEAQDITSGIPEQWKKEAEQIRQYAYGSRETFEPDGTIVDSSIETEQKEDVDKFPFIYRLQKYCNSEDVAPKPDTIISAYEKYISCRETDEDKFSLGLYVLKNYDIIKKTSQEKPLSFSALVLEVGLLAVSDAFGLSLDEQAEVAAELVSHRYQFKKPEFMQHMFKLAERFRELLRKKLTLSTWIHIAKATEIFLSDTNDAEAFCDLHENVLKLCGSVFSSQCPLDERYKKLGELHLAIETIKNCFCSRNIREAISSELAALEKGIQLEIKIDSEKVTDGYVYFHIKNVGKTTVTLGSGGYDNLSILVQRGPFSEKEVNIASVSTLHSQHLTGARVELFPVDQENEIPVTLKVVQKTDNGEVILCQDSRSVSWGTCGSKIHVGTSHKQYNTKKAVAFNEEKLLKGRESDQAKIREAIPKGVTVICGPSRIGKTSLLNWVQLHASTQKSCDVMTVLFGGEYMKRKEVEWKYSFLSENEDIPYDDSDAMSRYLLADTICHGLDNSEFYSGPKTASPELFDTIRNILTAKRQYRSSLRDRYFDLDQLLQKHNMQIWILLDEFQKVVERWKGLEHGTEFEKICSIMSDEKHDRSIANIKLIVCGSDELLRHMVLHHKSVWKDIFNDATPILIEPLEKEPFDDMIENDPALKGTNIVYDDSALDALFAYTGGVALYGKMVCNAILDDIAVNPDAYINRERLYAFDIAKATQLLLEKQNSEIKLQDMQTISEIYGAVTQGLDKNAQNILKYMARWLETHTEYNCFDKAVFSEKPLREGLDLGDIEDILEIAKARGIVYTKDKQHYAFRTLFYYFAFIGSAPTLNDLEKLIFAEEHITESNADWIKQVQDIFENQEITPGQAIDLIEPLEKDEAIKDELHRHFGGKTVKIGTNYEGDDRSTNIEQQTNIQFNVQSITNTLNNIFAAGSDTSKLRSSIQDLPRLQNYLPQGLEDGNLSEASISRAYDNMASDLEESIENATLQAEQQGHSPEKVEYWRILKFESIEKYNEFKDQYDLPECFLKSLRFAYQLDKVFERGAFDDSEDIDYSPVTIMYCKLIESMLKEYHTKVYAKYLKNYESDLAYPADKTKKYKWGEIIDLPQYQQKNLTIGSFRHPLVKTDWAIKQLADRDEQQIREWEQHKIMVSIVHKIRNPSAHGNKNYRISLDDKNKVTKQILDQKGLLRIVQLVPPSL